MKKTKIIVLLIFISLTCIGQTKSKKGSINRSNKTNMSGLTVNKDFEKFDFKTFDAKKDERRDEYAETLESGTFIYMAKGDLELYYQETPLNSLFSISKVYYANGNIKQKGVGYIYWFEKGVWYYYDENGKLIKEVNFDELFKFTFEAIFEFCTKERIPVARGADAEKDGYTTHISREISNTSNSCWWTIRWLKKPTIVETITINGVTGKIESRKEVYYSNE